MANTNLADNILIFFSWYFSAKIRLGILYELPALADNSYEMSSFVFSE